MFAVCGVFVVFGRRGLFLYRFPTLLPQLIERSVLVLLSVPFHQQQIRFGHLFKHPRIRLLLGRRQPVRVVFQSGFAVLFGEHFEVVLPWDVEQFECSGFVLSEALEFGFEGTTTGVGGRGGIGRGRG